MKKDNTKVLIIVAHPDDAEISMGMRIYDYVQSGCEVFVHSLSMGGKKDNNQKLKNIRVKETQEASNILGIHSYTFSDFSDTLFEENRVKIRTEVEKLVAKIQPDIVYTHYSNDLNQDHRQLHHATMIAFRPKHGQTCKEIYCYQVPSYGATNFHPNYYVELTQAQVKIKLVSNRISIKYTIKPCLKKFI